MTEQQSTEIIPAQQTEQDFSLKLDSAMMEKMAGDSGGMDRLVKEQFDTINNLEVKGIITQNEHRILVKAVVDAVAWNSKFLIRLVHTHLLMSGSIGGKVREQALGYAQAAALERALALKQEAVRM